MHSIGGTSGIGAPLPPNRIGGDEFIRYIGDRLILDFHEGAGTTVRDLSGNGNNGTLNGPTWELNRLSFDGTSDYIDVPDSTSLHSLNELTLLAQIKLNALDVLQTIITKEYAGEAYPDYQLRVLDTNLLRIGVNTGTGPVTGVNWVDADSESSLIKDKWFFVAGVYNGSQVQPYINAVADGTPAAVSGTTYNNGYNVTIGYSAPNLAYLSGTISFVRINATALSALQIQNEYLWNKFRS